MCWFCHNQGMHTDPSMRKYDGNTAIKCPACPGYMVSLRDFDITTSNEGPTFEADFTEYVIWGWWAYIYNFLFGSLDFKLRKNRVADLKQKVLPEFPASLICSQCLHVTRRK